jgi:hypothetical protein
MRLPLEHCSCKDASFGVVIYCIALKSDVYWRPHAVSQYWRWSSGSSHWDNGRMRDGYLVNYVLGSVYLTALALSGSIKIKEQAKKYLYENSLPVVMQSVHSTILMRRDSVLASIDSAKIKRNTSTS